MQSLLCRVHSSADLSDVFLRGMGPVDLRGRLPFIIWFRFGRFELSEISRDHRIMAGVSESCRNVVGFMPFGALLPALKEKPAGFWRTALFSLEAQPVHRTFTACATGRKL